MTTVSGLCEKMSISLRHILEYLRVKCEMRWIYFKGFLFLFLMRERDRMLICAHAQRKNPRHIPKRAKSPMRGLTPQPMRSWPELKSPVRGSTNEPSRRPSHWIYFKIHQPGKVCVVFRKEVSENVDCWDFRLGLPLIRWLRSREQCNDNSSQYFFYTWKLLRE